MAKKKNNLDAAIIPGKVDKKEKVAPTVKTGAWEKKKPPQFIVRGQVKQTDGSPAAGVRVRAWDKDMRKKQKLGDAHTDQDGRYEIAYTAEKFRRAEKGRADLRVCVVDEKGNERVSSDVMFNAPAKAVIDLTLHPEQEQLSEFELLVNAIMPLLKGQGKGDKDLPVAELKEKDIAFLANDSGQPQERIAFLVEAAKAALDSRASTKDALNSSHVGPSSGSTIPVEAFYGWFRQGCRHISMNCSTRARTCCDVLLMPHYVRISSLRHWVTRSILQGWFNLAD